MQSEMTNESAAAATTTTALVSTPSKNNNGKKSSDSGEEKAQLSADVSLPAEVLEKLYQSYTIKQKRDGLSSFLIASIMFDLWAIIVPQGQRIESMGEYWELVFCVPFRLPSLVVRASGVKEDPQIFMLINSLQYFHRHLREILAPSRFKIQIIL